MRSMAIPLFVVACVIGLITAALAFSFQDVVRLTEDFVCPAGGHYEFRRETSGSNTSHYIECWDEEGTVLARVTGKAFLALAVPSVLGWFFLLMLRVARVGQRKRMSPPAEISLTASEKAQILDILADGRKIRAIKEVREMTGAGLAEAKAYVEEMERKQKEAGNL